MARAILSQLLIQDTSLLLHLETTMTSSGQAVLCSRELAKELLNIALRSRKTYVILDGIDECARDDRKEICTWFRSFADSLPTAKQDEIRCLFLSQDDGFARKDLSMLPTLSITEDRTSGDIVGYTRHWQKRIEERFGSLQDTGLDLFGIVPKRSQGMFIFAKSVLHLLHEWMAERFPHQLEEVYSRILQRLLDSHIAVQQRDITKKLLSWISLSKRPLRWYEIQAAISIDLEKESVNDANRRLVDTSKYLCASFVEIYPDQTVVFVHGTVRDFLKSAGVEVMIPAKVELELCLLSIAYLNLPAICTPGKDSLIRGHFAFYDYAVAYWSHHFMAWLSETDHDDSDILELEETFEPFIDQHFRHECPPINVSKQMHEKLQPMKDFEFYESLTQAVVWSRKQLLVADDLETDENKQYPLDFPNISRLIRSLLEDTVKENPAQDVKEALELYYGRKWFRCPMLYCRHFYDGFEAQDDRGNHVLRRKRAYMCTFEGCHMATFGCVSKKDLDKHLLDTHGVGRTFPTVQDPNGSSRVLKHPATFQCTLCPKRFTRAYNMRSHLRAHTNERPFTCTVCGKAFARQCDRKMHQNLHSEEKKFVCKGDLKNGGQWGCGRRFARVGALGRHFRSEAGRICTKPLLDEEMVEQQRIWEESTDG
ncbi:hypothetical protein B0T14DRAFT_146178 [Immersiella caudata]|uniref:C2H2-type domain-containing protein n=1 Tax=Immersiella caudata TaxID=314043 RepID=A0AA39X681_9PEZI|nr:hypothetical protein B0T14DRAFT_146178 [Immersiella caudata]